jgi:hypothetical protein
MTTDSPKGTARPRRRWRGLLATLLLVLAGVLAPIAIVAAYAKAQITDTGRYVETVAPLASDPAIQSYAADTLTTELFQQVDVQQYVTDVLPERAQVLGAPITTAVQAFTRGATLRVLESDQFQQVWVQANRRAHEKLVKVLTGDGGAVVVSRDGAVDVDLAAVLGQVKERLQAAGVTAFDDVSTDGADTSITLFRSESLYQARSAVGFVEGLALVLPVIVFGFVLAAVWLSRNRRRAFVWGAVSLTLGVLVLAVFLAVARGLYLDAAAGADLPEPAASAMYDALLRSLHTVIRNILLLSLVVVLVALYIGPSRPARALRATVGRAVGWLGVQADESTWRVLRPERAVGGHKSGIQAIVAVLAFATAFWWSYPTPGVLVAIALVALAVLGLVEFFGRPPTPVTAGDA